MSKLTVLRFTGHYSRYNPGERAGFSPAKAAAILRIHPAVAVREGAAGAGGPAGVPTHRDPSAIHGDPPPPANTGDALPDDFPARDVLAEAGIVSRLDLRTAIELGPLTELDGIGEARAEKIREALDAFGSELDEE